VFRKILQKTENILQARGFESEAARTLLGIQILAATAAMGVGLLALPLTIWPLAFGIGAGVAACSFWQLCRITQAFILQKFTRQLWLRLFLRFNLRLVLTGGVLFLAIISLSLPLLPLLVGLAISMICVMAWGVNRAVSKPIKES
jgi:hypothetical protein